jgi:C1A family cysteine protease
MAISLEEIQRTLRDRGNPWTAGRTSVSELSGDEQRLRLGASSPDLETRLAIATPERNARGAGAYPAAFDWRNVNGADYITSIKDQGGCGSCVAFGVAATLESAYQIDRGDPNSGIDLSEAQLFYCYAEAEDGMNCLKGWWPDNAYKYAVADGVTLAQYFPYTAGDQACNLLPGWNYALLYPSAYSTITDTSQMKDWLANNGPLTTCFTVYEDFYYYTSGVYSPTSKVVEGGHCVEVIGYDDSQGFWIAKNSWGTGWGESGFFCIAYGVCGFDAGMWTVDGIADSGWMANAKIAGLFAWSGGADSWVFVDASGSAYPDMGGWKMIANDSDEITAALFSQLIAAKAAGRPVNLYRENGVIQQEYVF